MRRGSICSQSGFRHGCQARRNSPKNTWNVLKEVLGKPGNRPFFQSSNDGTGIIPRAFWVLYVERLYVITGSYKSFYRVSRHILVGEKWSSSFLFCVFSYLNLLSLRLKWSWTELISFTRISLCTMWMVRGIIPTCPCRSWASRICHKLRRWSYQICLPQNYLSVSNLSSVARLFEGCKSIIREF